VVRLEVKERELSTCSYVATKIEEIIVIRTKKKFRSVTEFKCSRNTKYENCFHGEIKNELNPLNVCYPSV